jgi:hypothetical protein
MQTVGTASTEDVPEEVRLQQQVHPEAIPPEYQTQDPVKATAMYPPEPHAADPYPPNTSVALYPPPPQPTVQLYPPAPAQAGVPDDLPPAYDEVIDSTPQRDSSTA